jgi:hypothetical protein
LAAIVLAFSMKPPHMINKKTTTTLYKRVCGCIGFLRKVVCFVLRQIPAMNVSPKILLTTLPALSFSWSNSKGEIEDNN